MDTPSYSFRILERAWINTKSDFSFHEPRRLVVKLIWSAGVIFLAWLLGLDGILNTRLNWYGMAFVVFLTLFGAVLLWNVIAAPYLLQQEADAQIAALQDALDNRDKQQKAMVRLWKLRKQGVPHRNLEVTTIPDYEEWFSGYEKWRTKVLREARKISPNFEAWLETLDRMGPSPKLSKPAIHNDHLRYRNIMSEILVRMEAFLKAAMLKKDIE